MNFKNILIRKDVPKEFLGKGDVNFASWNYLGIDKKGEKSLLHFGSGGGKRNFLEFGTSLITVVLLVKCLHVNSAKVNKSMKVRM